MTMAFGLVAGFFISGAAPTADAACGKAWLTINEHMHLADNMRTQYPQWPDAPKRLRELFVLQCSKQPAAEVACVKPGMELLELYHCPWVHEVARNSTEDLQMEKMPKAPAPAATHAQKCNAVFGVLDVAMNVQRRMDQPSAKLPEAIRRVQALFVAECGKLSDEETMCVFGKRPRDLNLCEPAKNAMRVAWGEPSANPGKAP